MTSWDSDGDGIPDHFDDDDDDDEDWWRSSEEDQGNSGIYCENSWFGLIFVLIFIVLIALA